MGQVEDELWLNSSYKEKNRTLYETQNRVLEMFFERGAITQQQFSAGKEYLTNMDSSGRSCTDWYKSDFPN